MNNKEMPIGLGMCLAMNPEAMKKFSNLSDLQKHEIVNGTHSITSKAEMQQYVNNIMVKY